MLYCADCYVVAGQVKHGLRMVEPWVLGNCHAVGGMGLHAFCNSPNSSWGHQSVGLLGSWCRCSLKDGHKHIKWK